MKFIRVFLVFILFFLFSSSYADAHIGGGPPFLKINGKYIDTNPYYQGETTLNIAQDFPKESYLVGKPTTFEIDLTRLSQLTTISPSFAQNLTFRWTFATGDNFDQKEKNTFTDNKITHTFSQPKSYLVITEAKAPNDPTYIVIDTTQVDVLPNASYKLPKAAVFVGTQNNDPQKPVRLVTQTTFDPSSNTKKFYWDFNDGKLYPGVSIERTFDTLSSYGTGVIYLRSVDEKGFSADTGFHVEAKEGKLHFFPFGNMKNIPVTFGSYDEAIDLSGKQSTSSLPPRAMFFYIGAGVVLILLFGFIVKMVVSPGK